MEEGVGSEEEQVGAVGPGHGVEDQLPRTLRHLGSIFGQQPAPLCKWLQREKRDRATVRQRGRGRELILPFLQQLMEGSGDRSI